MSSIFNVKIQKWKGVALSNEGYYGIYHFFAAWREILNMVWSECTECVKSPNAVSECRLFTAKQYLSIAVIDANN